MLLAFMCHNSGHRPPLHSPTRRPGRYCTRFQTPDKSCLRQRICKAITIQAMPSSHWCDRAGEVMGKQQAGALHQRLILTGTGSMLQVTRFPSEIWLRDQGSISVYIASCIGCHILLLTEVTASRAGVATRALSSFSENVQSIATCAVPEQQQRAGRSAHMDTALRGRASFAGAARYTGASTPWILWANFCAFCQTYLEIFGCMQGLCAVPCGLTAAASDAIRAAAGPQHQRPPCRDACAA